MKTAALIFIFWAFQSHAECKGTALIAFQVDSPSEAAKFKEENKDGLIETYAILDAPAAGDGFGKLNFAALTRPKDFEGLVKSARSHFKNVKALCGSERIPFNSSRVPHVTARLSKFRSENARPLAEKAAVKAMKGPSAKYGISERLAIRIEKSEGFAPLDDLILYSFEKENGRSELALDQEFKYTESLFNKIYTTNYLYLEMIPQ